MRLRRAIRNLDVAAESPLYPLLFDPQTAGGLLAAVPALQAQECLAALHASGYPRAAIVGAIAAKSASIEPIAICFSYPGAGSATVGVATHSRETANV